MTDIQSLAQQWLNTSGYNTDKAAENAKAKNEYWNASNGTTVIRLLPPGPSNCQLLQEGFWTAKYFKYWINLPKVNAQLAASGGEKEDAIIAYAGKKSLPTLYTSDPIAAAIDEASAVIPGDILREMRPRVRCLANVYIKEIYDERNNAVDQSTWNKVVIADLPIGFHDHIRKDISNPIMGMYINPFMGLDIIIQRYGKGKTGTEYKYSVRAGVGKSPILDNPNDLTAMLNDVPDLMKVISDNCERDKDRLEEGAVKIRSWANSARASNPFGQQAPAGPGFTPSSLPGQAAPQPWTPPAQQQWTPPGAPAAAPGAPGAWAPPSAPTPPAQPWTPPQTATPSAPQGWTPPAPPAQAAPVAPPAQPWTPPTPPASPEAQTQQPPAWTPPTPPQAPQQMQPPAQPPVQQQPPAAMPQQAPAQPQGKPPCYKEFKQRNGTDPSAMANPRNDQCKTCIFKAPCAFEST